MKRSKNKQAFRLDDLAARVGAEVTGDGATEITGVAPIQDAGPGDLSFVANTKYEKHIAKTRASALVLSMELSADIPAIRHSNPYLTFARIIDIIHPVKRLVAPGIDEAAVIADSAVIADGAGIGPMCHVGENSTIGEDSQLVSTVYVGRNVQVGRNCLFYPGVRILDDSVIGDSVILHPGVVIGSDGFGFAQGESGARKIQQIGHVEIGNDVEIGSNTTVDRGALGPTRIGDGTKIDNLVQIAHNVEIGRHCLIAAQTGISGSTRVGNGVIMAGQVGLAGHLEIGDGVMIGAKSGISKTVEPGKSIFGYPARDIMEMMRIEASLNRLPELLKRVKRLEDKSGGD